MKTRGSYLLTPTKLAKCKKSVNTIIGQRLGTTGMLSTVGGCVNYYGHVGEQYSLVLSGGMFTFPLTQQLHSLVYTCFGQCTQEQSQQHRS